MGGAGSGPAHARPALARCIGIASEDFAAHYWAARQLLTPASTSGADFTDLLSESAIDELLSRRGLRTPFIRMAKQGKVIPPREFTRSGGTGAGIADQVADDKVLGLIADGATLVLQALHRTWPPLVDFGSALAAELGHPVQINSYLTPPQNQGFAPHYDTHDVFVLQVSGTKRWIIHEPVLTAPLPSQEWERYRDQVARRAGETPLLDVVLQPGDALYLPRGFIHAAQAQGETSLHLTVGLHPVTRYSILKHLLNQAADDPALRTSLPMGLQPDDEAVLAEQLRATVARFAEFGSGLPVERVSAVLADELAGATRPAPIEPMKHLAALAELGPQTRLVLRPGLRTRVELSGEHARLIFLDTRLELPAAAAAALDCIRSGRPVCSADLPGLDAQAGLDLLRSLLTAAVLVPAAGEADGG